MVHGGEFDTGLKYASISHRAVESGSCQLVAVHSDQIDTSILTVIPFHPHVDHAFDMGIHISTS